MDLERILRRVPRGRLTKAAGLVVGLGCLAGAVYTVLRDKDDFSQAIAALRDPPPTAVALVLGAVVVGLVLTGVLFYLLIRRFGRVPFWEMQALISASALVNYLPLRPGFIGRVAYHRLRHGIRAAHTVRTILEAIALSGVVASLFLLALVLLRRVGVDGAWALAAPSLLAFLGVMPRLRPLCAALLVRQAELALWTLRYWAVFRLIGVELDLESAIVLGSIGVLSTLVPFVSGGLGIREWVIGLLAPLVSHEPVTTGTAIMAELVHRVAELAVVAPAGLVSIGVLVRHNRRLARDRAATPSP